MKKALPALKYWVVAMRPWSFPASTMPAVLAFTYVFFLSQTQGLEANWWLGIVAIAGATVFQVSGNLISDYFDYTKGVDRADTFGSSRLLVDQTFSPQHILWYGIVHLAIGCVLGFYLLAQVGWVLLPIGILGIISAAFYYQFKSKALGDLLIFIVFGPLIGIGVFYVMTGTLSWQMIAIIMPLSCITVGILHANNTRDIMHDKRANIQTVAMLMGVSKSILMYKALIALTYVLMLFLVAAGTLHWSTLLVFLTLPLAWRNCKSIEKAQEFQPENIVDLDVKTAQLQLSFSGLLSSLIVVSVWL